MRRMLLCFRVHLGNQCFQTWFNTSTTFLSFVSLFYLINAIHLEQKQLQYPWRIHAHWCQHYLSIRYCVDLGIWPKMQTQKLLLVTLWSSWDLLAVPLITFKCGTSIDPRGGDELHRHRSKAVCKKKKLMSCWACRNPTMQFRELKLICVMCLQQRLSWL